MNHDFVNPIHLVNRVSLTGEGLCSFVSLQSLV
jgi:hypothetical protein